MSIINKFLNMIREAYRAITNKSISKTDFVKKIGDLDTAVKSVGITSWTDRTINHHVADNSGTILRPASAMIIVGGVASLFVPAFGGVMVAAGIGGVIGSLFDIAYNNSRVYDRNCYTVEIMDLLIRDCKRAEQMPEGGERTALVASIERQFLSITKPTFLNSHNWKF